MRKLRNEWKLVWKFVNKLWFKIKPLFGGLLFDLFLKLITWFESSIWLLRPCGAYFFSCWIQKRLIFFINFYPSFLTIFVLESFSTWKVQEEAKIWTPYFIELWLGVRECWHFLNIDMFHWRKIITKLAPSDFPRNSYHQFHAGNTQFIM